MKIKVLDFYTEWCGPCRLLAPIIQAVTTELGIELIKIDASKSPEAQKYGITSVPTLVILNEKDEEVTRQTGLVSKAALRSLLSGMSRPN